MTAIINTYNKHITYVNHSILNRIERYYKGKLNSYKDEPTIIYPDGDKAWFKDDKLHREKDLPDIEYVNGSKFWYKYGKLHREDNKPASIFFAYFNDGVREKEEFWLDGVFQK